MYKTQKAVIILKKTDTLEYYRNAEFQIWGAKQLNRPSVNHPPDRNIKWNNYPCKKAPSKELKKSGEVSQIKKSGLS